MFTKISVFSGFLALILISSSSHAASDKKLKSQILRKISSTQKTLKSKISFSKKLSAIEGLKKYLSNKTAKNAGPNYLWIEGFKMSLYDLKKKDLKKRRCSKLKGQLFTNYAPQGSRKKDLPGYAQPTYSILKSLCKKL